MHTVYDTPNEQIFERSETPERDIREALVYFQRGFAGSGLSLGETYAAMDEFEPVMRQLIQLNPTEFRLPDHIGLTPAQVAAVRAAHYRYARESGLHYRRLIWQALKVIADLIGRRNLNPGGNFR